MMAPSRSSSRLMVALATSGLLALSLACSGKDPYNPGTPLGTFHVTAKLARTSCGPTPDPWEFDVKLNHDGTILYWIQGGAPIHGAVDAAATTQLRAETVHDVRAADPKKKLGACTVTRADRLAVTLAGADAKPTRDPSLATTFQGQLTYAFTPTEGSDCADQVASMGGGFDALPCEVQYEVLGAFASPPR